ncbi:uncharacterized protein N7496_009325 [Penicillium cataractarum]|uniref:Ketoreductase (KR) domain-containing protein n=1 Tax=Penicillium cataractarum TaxID=2100454 RepID=A0A9W9UZT7_9EURO|nr:uncharacterized protein N7496_009325 [Penicillium cataractarum]KAJ5363612.1 hypothetical protein N7496_009325 [Penicillium cataractarum]
MTGTVLITGANGSLAIPFIKSLLSQYPSYTLIGTVRNHDADSDPNTANLRNLVSQFPQCSVSIYKLDLNSLSEVDDFAEKLAVMIQNKKFPPLTAIICNAFSWSLSGSQKYSVDGYERTFQVSHLSHHLLVLKLLNSMNREIGRVIMLGSVTHDPEKPNPLCKLDAQLPSEIDELVYPTPDKPGEEHDRGFQRYGTAKLANVMFMHELNERLIKVSHWEKAVIYQERKRDTDKLKHPFLNNITVTAMDPGGLVDSRANKEQKLFAQCLMFTMKMFIPFLRTFTTAVRSSEDSGTDLLQVAMGPDFHGKRGYFVGLMQAESAMVSKCPENRERLWRACGRWLGLNEEYVCWES